ncbi:helix-hairpin-helix domain-containing protein [Streptomyces sp. NBC_01190]|uniref:helix-hairpin-helix domain-containing protein n=1 Tax=Streptomyces sp. NBC_01190 TaxID=2903767 RepID=UPI0038661D99|nr:ATP-binding domain-containing protein [Streptomyces sp. NBC_01190]
MTEIPPTPPTPPTPSDPSIPAHPPIPRPARPSQSSQDGRPGQAVPVAASGGPAQEAGGPEAARPRPQAGLAGLAAAVRSIERGENPAAPAPRGDAAEARRKRREAMAAEAAALQAAEAAQVAGVPAPGAPDVSEEVAEPAGVAGPDGGGDPGAARDADQDGTAEPDAERGVGVSSPAAGADASELAARTVLPTPPEAPAGVATAAPVRGRAAADRGAAPRPAAMDPAAVEEARRVLLAGGAPGELAAEAVRGLGERAGEALREDPWRVLGLAGVRVEHADAFARAVLGDACGPGDARRARALVGYLLERAAEQGHTALTSDTLKAALARHSVPDPDAAVAAAVEDGTLLAFGTDAGTGAEEDPDEAEDDSDRAEADVPLLLGLDRYALAEESLADGLIRLLRSFEGAPGGGSGTPVAWEKAAADAPSSSAAELIRAVAGSGLVLHAGGEAARAEPAAVVVAARAAGLRAYAAAYTGNGRRRLADAVGEDAALTVAGLLDGQEGPGRAEDGSLALDLLAVLDAPQLSVEEATDLVEAVPDGARLVLSGDPHALWSAGPGRAFADLLAAKVCPRVTSRTPDPGPIGELTSCVSIGELAAVAAPDREVVVVPVRDPQEALHRTVQLVADSVPRAIGVPADKTQVITVAHGGPVGTRTLNAALKERLNPGPGRFGGFDPGDRVVYVPAPGHTLPGTVVGAEAEGLRLACETGSVLVPREDVAGKVRHGWAVTGHQAAGMRWPAVVVVVPGDAGPLLTRSWVYTAFARGERHLSVVRGAEQGLAEAVAGPAAKERTTRLTGVLRDLAAEG